MRSRIYGGAHLARACPVCVTNSRFLILPEAHFPNLASRLLKQVLARLSDDWLARWGHPVALVETFVDPERFRGTTYKVSGWSELGPTSGFGRHAQDFYEPHERPKQLWVKELVVLDALHTQDLTAQKLHFEHGADYVMTVKTNPKSLYETLETKLQEQSFPPSADPGDASLPA